MASSCKKKRKQRFMIFYALSWIYFLFHNSIFTFFPLSRQFIATMGCWKLATLHIHAFYYEARFEKPDWMYYHGKV